MAETALQTDSTHAGWMDESSQVQNEASGDNSGPERALRALAGRAADRSRGDGSRDTENSPVSHRGSEGMATFELVKEACESIRISEERVAVLESELEQVSLQSRDDLRKMSARFAAAQEEIKTANARAKAAEARAVEAENWLTKINEAIRQGFGPHIRRTASLENDEFASQMSEQEI